MSRGTWNVILVLAEGGDDEVSIGRLFAEELEVELDDDDDVLLISESVIRDEAELEGGRGLNLLTLSDKSFGGLGIDDFV